MLRFICHTDIDFFSHLLIIQRAISIRLDISVLNRFILVLCQIRFKRTIAWQTLFNRIPHFQKSDGQRSDCISLQTDAGIFPFSIRVRKSKIFVCKIITASKSYFSINDRNFAMITVVQK